MANMAITNEWHLWGERKKSDVDYQRMWGNFPVFFFFFQKSLALPDAFKILCTNISVRFFGQQHFSYGDKWAICSPEAKSSLGTGTEQNEP